MSRGAAVEDVHGLIGLIYDAALDPGLWPTFLAELCGRFGGHQATLYSHHAASGTGGIHAEFGIEAGFRDSYVDHYAARNPFAPAVLRLEPGACATVDRLLGREAYRRSEFFADWVRPQGCEEFVTASLDRRFEAVTGITVLRGSRRFDDGERARWSLLVPHLRRALDVHGRLGLAAERSCGLSTALDAVGVGVLIVTDDGEVAFANPPAEKVLSGRSGLTVRARRIVAETPAAEAVLLRAVRAAAAAGRGQAAPAGAVVTLPGRQGGVTSVLVCPIRSEAAVLCAGRPLALLVFGGPRRREARREELAHALGLTPAEARLLEALVAGESLAGHADANALSRETVRSQMRGVLAKTGTRRQVDAIKWVLDDPVLSRP